MKWLIILSFLSCIILSACKNETNESKGSIFSKEFQSMLSTAPKPECSSPEKLLKSYWKFEIWCDTTFRSDTTYPNYGFFTIEYKKYFIDEALKRIKSYKKEHYLNNSQIDKIESQSQDRVIIYTKEFRYNEDKEYSDFKYIFTKNNTDWKIEEIFQQCNWCKGTGKEKDYSYPYSSEDKVCSVCKGLGWKSIMKQ
jgi:hypothetical protein